MHPRIILFILFPLIGFSQAPQKINFQSILRNNNGEVVSNKAVSLKISILTGSISGSSVYTETQTKTTDASGLISLQIGFGTVLSGVFASIAWGDFPHFIKLEADFSGGNNFVLLGSQELMSMPYALYASKTDTSSLNLVNRFNSKVNISDTSNMLSNYRTGLNNKVNFSDTAIMLANYKTIITDLQKHVELLSSYTSLLASGLVDIDRNNYPVAKIGNQIWMKENLKVTKYRNGDAIPTGLSAADWRSTNSGAYAIFLNNNGNDAIYGKLYNWYAVTDNRGLCPTGWHVPTDAEWTTLTTYLGGEGVAGGKMKSVGTAYWNNSNIGATNESGFSGLPGGLRNDGDTDYYNIGRVAYFWSATESSRDGFSWIRTLSDVDVFVTKAGDNGLDRNNGLSVRCLRD